MIFLLFDFYPIVKILQKDLKDVSKRNYTRIPRIIFNLYSGGHNAEGFEILNDVSSRIFY